MKTDDIIAQIETDKVTIDIRAPHDGVITSLTVREIETSSPNRVLLLLDGCATHSSGHAAHAFTRSPLAPTHRQIAAGDVVKPGQPVAELGAGGGGAAAAAKPAAAASAPAAAAGPATNIVVPSMGARPISRDAGFRVDCRRNAVFPAFTCPHRSRHSRPASSHTAAQPCFFPSLAGDSISEGTVAAIVKGPGSAVNADDVVAQIETDKVTIDVRAPSAGTVMEIKVSGCLLLPASSVKSYFSSREPTWLHTRPDAPCENGAACQPASPMRR